MKKTSKADTRPTDKRPKGAIYRSELKAQKEADQRALDRAKKICTKPLEKLCNTFNTYVSGGTPESREALKNRYI